MGSQPISFHKQTEQQIEKYIRSTSLTTSRVSFSFHATERMEQYEVSAAEVYEVLRRGKIQLPPEPDMKTGDLSCRMGYFICGRNLYVQVALSDDDPNMVIVTVIEP